MHYLKGVFKKVLIEQRKRANKSNPGGKLMKTKMKIN